MGRNRTAVLIFFAASFLAGSLRLLCQQATGPGTYDGEPVYPVGKGVTAPQPKFEPEPEYDDESRKAKIEGRVTLTWIVTKEGKTADIKLVRGLNPRLDAAAFKAVSQWRFDPATKDGKPVAVRLMADIDFHP
jgi:periplasmic protein TonB